MDSFRRWSLSVSVLPEAAMPEDWNRCPRCQGNRYVHAVATVSRLALFVLMRLPSRVFGARSFELGGIIPIAQRLLGRVAEQRRHHRVAQRWRASLGAHREREQKLTSSAPAGGWCHIGCT